MLSEASSCYVNRVEPNERNVTEAETEAAAAAAAGSDDETMMIRR